MSAKSSKSKTCYRNSNSIQASRSKVFFVLPNPSVKLSVNGVPHWPSSAGPAAHFALAVQRATPSSPAYLKR